MSTTVGKASKRKLALVIGYVGTPYHGLQRPNRKEAAGGDEAITVVPTVEEDLERALNAAGFIADFNMGDLSRLNWSRASRTDKGVHAARTVLSAKLAVQPSTIDEATGHCNDELVRQLNAALPDAIRAWSVVKMPKSFQARVCCSWREYEYLLPASLLEDRVDGTSSDGAAAAGTGDAGGMATRRELFRSVLQSFEGHHSFHNFTRARALTKKASGKKRPWSKGPRDGPGGGEEEAGLAEESEPESGSESESEGEDLTSAAEPSEKPAPVVEPEAGVGAAAANASSLDSLKQAMSALPEAQRTIHRCELLSEPFVDDSGHEFLRLRIAGSSFLLNQIRFMVGAALGVARGLVPPWLPEAALAAPFAVRLPIAPPDGLVLMDAGFERYKQRLITMSPPEARQEHADPPTKRQKQRHGASQQENVDPVVLLRADDKCRADAWLETVVYPHVAKRWTEPRIQETGARKQRQSPGNAASSSCTDVGSDTSRQGGQTDGDKAAEAQVDERTEETVSVHWIRFTERFRLDPGSETARKLEARWIETKAQIDAAEAERREREGHRRRAFLAKARDQGEAFDLARQ